MAARSGLLMSLCFLLSVAFALSATSDECNNVPARYERWERLYKRHSSLWEAVQASLEHFYCVPRRKAERLSQEVIKGLTWKLKFKSALMLSFPLWSTLLGIRPSSTPKPTGRCAKTSSEKRWSTPLRPFLVEKNRLIGATEATYTLLFKKDPPSELPDANSGSRFPGNEGSLIVLATTLTQENATRTHQKYNSV
jgi:hypothetical protein